MTTAHLLLAVLELDHQLAVVGKALPEPLAAVCGGGRVLREYGVDKGRALVGVAELPGEQEAVAPVGRAAWWSRRHQVWRSARSNPPWTASAVEATLRAGEDAARRGTRPGSEHLLVAVLADGAGPACQLLRRLGVEPTQVREVTFRGLTGT